MPVRLSIRPADHPRPPRPHDWQERLSNSPLRPVDVFFYGIYQDEALLREYSAHPRHRRNALLRGYRLRLGPLATLLRDDLAIAWGRLVSLPLSEVRTLYARDDAGDYAPEVVTVETADGEQVPALCYTLLNAPHRREDNPRYRDQLADVMSRHGLPVTQLRHSDARATASLSVQYEWMRAELEHTEFWKQLCQCTSAGPVRSSSDPDRMLAALCAYVFLDEFIYTHFPLEHPLFKVSFPGPALYAHGTRSRASPAWLLDERGHGLESPDFARIGSIVTGMLGGGLRWLARAHREARDAAETSLPLQAALNLAHPVMRIDADAILAHEEQFDNVPSLF